MQSSVFVICAIRMPLHGHDPADANKRPACAGPSACLERQISWWSKSEFSTDCGCSRSVLPVRPLTTPLRPEKLARQKANASAHVCPADDHRLSDDVSGASVNAVKLSSSPTFAVTFTPADRHCRERFRPIPRSSCSHGSSPSSVAIDLGQAAGHSGSDHDLGILPPWSQRTSSVRATAPARTSAATSTCTIRNLPFKHIHEETAILSA